MKLNKETIKDCFAVKITATENGEVIGRVRFFVLFNELHESPFGLMEDLFVEEDNRNRGIGEALVKAALEEARKNKCYKFVFTCSRQELYGWYEKQGFVKYGAEFRVNLN